jgi:hypothetical protein
MAKTLYKKPNEEIYFSMSFARQLDGTETITSVSSFSTSIVSSKTGVSPLPITIDTPVIDTPATSVTFKISNGTLDTLYNVTILVRTSNINLIQGDGELQVSNTIKS